VAIGEGLDPVRPYALSGSVRPFSRPARHHARVDRSFAEALPAPLERVVRAPRVAGGIRLAPT
jgi:hypothetical protein